MTQRILEGLDARKPSPRAILTAIDIRPSTQYQDTCYLAKYLTLTSMTTTKSGSKFYPVDMDTPLFTQTHPLRIIIGSINITPNQ